MNTTIDDLLRGYDAEPADQLTTTEQVRAEQLLARISATPRSQDARPSRAAAARGTTRTTRATRATRARRPILIGVTAAAVLAVAAAGGSSLIDRLAHHATGPAASGLSFADVADWTPEPGHPALTSPAVERTASDCLSSLGVNRSGSSAAAATSNVDQRGSVLTVVATDPVTQERAWCLADATGVVLSQVIDSPTMPLPTVGAGQVNVQSQDGHGAGDRTISLTYGQAGPGVTGVTLTTPAGETVTATVGQGLWTLWWPPHDTSTDDLGGGTLTWTTTDGATHSAPVTSLYATS